MAANSLKMESFVREEMVSQLILLLFINQYKISSHKSAKCLKFEFLAGRGVDLNRNWSVDWGKKEKVFKHFHLIIRKLCFVQDL